MPRLWKARRTDRPPRLVVPLHAALLAGALVFVCGASVGGCGTARPVAGPPSPTINSTASAQPAALAGPAVDPSPWPQHPGPPRLALPGPFPGLLLIADRGNDRLLVVNGAKKVVWRYPRPGKKPTFPFHYDDDAFFVPGYRGIISSQEMQHTAQVISFPQGRVVWHYGRPGVPGSGPGRLDRPDDAYVLPDGTRTVADIVNQRILFISPQGKALHQYGTTGVAGHRPPRLLGAPNGDAPTPGGGMLITEISGSWVDAISRTGRLLWSVHTPAAYPSDAQLLPGGRILLADYSSPGRVFIIDRRGRVHWHYGPSSGSGRLDHPSLALPLPGGLIAISDDYRDRVVVVDMHTRKVVWQYGHAGVPGTGRGYLDTPDGPDFLPASALRADPRLAALMSQ